MNPTIALVSPGRTSSGGSAFAQNLATELEAVLGHRVPQAAVPARGKSDLPEEVRACDVVVNLGARVIPTEGKSIYWPLNVAPLDNGLDILPHTSPRNRARHVLLRSRYRQSVGRADGLVFGSHYARTLYMAKYAKGSQLPYRVIRGGTPSLDVLENQPDAASPPLIVVCSHLYPYKGILEFVEAFAEALPELPPGTRARIAGADRDPTYAAAVRRLVLQRSLDSVITIGPADAAELADMYSQADLCVFPSTCENAGSFSLYDGLHAGAATLCSDRSSMPEATNGAAHLVNPFDRQAFGRALVEVLTDDKALEDLRARSRAWREDAPTWRWRAEQLVEFVREVVA